MIGITQENGKTRLAIAYNGAAFNDVADTAAGGRSKLYGNTTEVWGIRTAMDYLSEPAQFRDGMELYGLRKSSRILVLRGWSHGRTQAEMFDELKALANATNPSRIVFENPNGYFLPLTFSTPTGDTDNFPTGYAASKYNCIPIRSIDPSHALAGNGLSARWELDFLLEEPKRFLQAASTQSGAGTIANAIADERSWPVLTFTLSGAGSSSFTVQNVGTYGGTKSVVLDLSGYSSGNWTVDFKNATIQQGTTDRPNVFVSGEFFEIEPGNNVITYSNTTNTSSRLLTWYPAFAL